MELDDCTLNTFNYSVTLPQSDNSPSDEFFFHVIWTCNGVTYDSGTINSVEAAYYWASTFLYEFGTWTLTDNVLEVTGTICETGELAFAYTEETEVYGCTDPSSSNYDYQATISDNSCSGAVTPEGGCKNPAATNYCAACTYDDGSCEFASDTVVFNTAAKVAIQSKIGACIFQTYDRDKLAGLTDEGIELNLQAYYITFGSQNNSDAAIFNTFLDDVNAECALFISCQASASFNSWLIGKFPDAVFLQYDQESEIASRGVTNSQYITGLASFTTLYGGTYQISEDSAPVYRTSSLPVARNAALAPLTYTTWGRQYEQLAPDRMVFSPTDQNYNLSLINNYFSVLLPNDITDFFTTLPNLTRQVELQWHNVDVGQQKPSDILSAYAIGEMARFTLAHTSVFAYIFWMRYAEIVKGTHVEFYPIKFVTTCFRMAYTFPVTLPVSGCNVIGFTDGSNAFRLLINNQTTTQHTISVSSFSIPSKNISGNITRNSVWAVDLDSAYQVEENQSETNFLIRPCSVNVYNFTAI